MKTAPVILFVYQRPVHSLMTIAALSQNAGAEETDLIIYSDAPKNSEAEEGVQFVRALKNKVRGFKSVTWIEKTSNEGLSRSITEGVKEQVAKFEKVIVLEDDMVTSPMFLSYMNKALDTYAFNEEVISIHGYNYPIKDKLPESYFLRGADCWGWATWKRGWDLYEPDGKKLMSLLEKSGEKKEFDFGGYYGYSKMLEKQISGENDSWAIRFYASAFLQNKLTLYPGKSLVQNIGLDSSGTHSGTDRQYIHESLLMKMPAFPSEIKPDPVAFDAVCHFFKDQQSWLKKLYTPFNR